MFMLECIKTPLSLKQPPFGSVVTQTSYGLLKLKTAFREKDFRFEITVSTLSTQDLIYSQYCKHKLGGKYIKSVY